MNYLHLINFGMLFEKNGSDFPSPPQYLMWHPTPSSNMSRQKYIYMPIRPIKVRIWKPNLHLIP
jgi:hypothetical protein